ncbi:hypothetical protein [Luteibaculum oceani]|uniref:Uncharacterized protein n=1 Tax=Luteibaculum oceani TaxID=1294296 RepID=A0A5C6USI9_9FLAO|nr:hypothetical protein [Luteibaculum oceani]TXC75614.1 hypothetical protein FRX97_11585 [Luteibaculum oceani]
MPLTPLLNRLIWLPRCFLGAWQDSTGRQLHLWRNKGNKLLVSIHGADKQPFTLSDLDENTWPSIDLEGTLKYNKSNDTSYISIEAGQSGLGPTYELYLCLWNKRGLTPYSWLNKKGIPIIKPNIGLGLYDDWEDHLGVPWAWPLEDFHKKIPRPK